MKVVTIHNSIPRDTYGYERSQICREQMIDGHVTVYSSLYDIPFDNYVNHMKRLGIESYYHCLLDLSDMARDACSVRLADISDDVMRGITQDKDGFVTRIDHEDCVQLFTSGLFLEMTQELITIYNRDGSYTSVTRDYPFQIVRTETQKFTHQFTLLIDTIRDADIVFRDEAIPLPPQLRRYFGNGDGQNKLHQFVHYDINSAVSLPFPVTNAHFIQTNAKTDGVFLPPVFVEPVKQVAHLGGYCIVASVNPIKRVRELLEWFKGSGFPVYVYGARGAVHADNIHYMGHVKDVPYGVHDFYVSNSLTESFSNALVEAQANGLTCLVKSGALAHDWHAEDLPNVYTFDYLDDIPQYEHNPFGTGGTYTKERVKALYDHYVRKVVDDENL